MAEHCVDINGNDICQIILQDNGTVLGLLCSPTNEPAPDPTYEEAQGPSVYLKGGPQDEFGTPNQECCEQFGYTFDNNVCYWSRNLCEPNPPDFTIVMNAQGNDGAFFDVDEGETCTLNVEFEYLFEFNCDDLLQCKIEKNDGNLELLGNTQLLINEKEEEITALEDLLAELQEQKETVVETTGTTHQDFEEEIAQLNSQIDALDAQIANLQSQLFGASPAQTAVLNAQIQIKQAQKAAVENLLQQTITEFNIYMSGAGGVTAELQQQCDEAQAQLDTCNQLLVDLQLQLADLQAALAENSPRIVDMLRGLDVCVTLEKVVPNQVSGTSGVFYESGYGLETVYEEQLFNIGGIELATTSIVEYFRENSDTGFLFQGGDCDSVINCVLAELGNDCDVVNENTFDSNWLTHSFTIADEETLSAITNEKIKLGLKVKNCECDFALLIDKIEMNKSCTKVRRRDLVVNECPGFDLTRECDNKKSWVALDEFDNRTHDLEMRITDYDTNHHKLVINSKEVDLDVNIARAIDTDVWCYMSDNPCLLSGCTTASTTGGTATTVTCNDLTGLLCTPLSSITTVKKFQEVMCTEMIDAKANKVMCGYPVLGEIYERYKNSELYCENKSSAFDYCTMIEFASLIGNYWVDLIEQVIPATTMWGSTYVHSNTVFDKQKFTYRRYTLFPCDEPTDFPFSAIGVDMGVDVTTIDTSVPELVGLPDCLIPSGVTETCTGVWNMQISDGSEFIGTVKVISNGDAPVIDPATGVPVTPTGGNPNTSPNNDTGPIVVISENDPTAPQNETK